MRKLIAILLVLLFHSPGKGFLNPFPKSFHEKKQLERRDFANSYQIRKSNVLSATSDDKKKQENDFIFRDFKRNAGEDMRRKISKKPTKQVVQQVKDDADEEEDEDVYKDEETLRTEQILAEREKNEKMLYLFNENENFRKFKDHLFVKNFSKPSVGLIGEVDDIREYYRKERRQALIQQRKEAFLSGEEEPTISQRKGFEDLYFDEEEEIGAEKKRARAVEKDWNADLTDQGVLKVKALKQQIANLKAKSTHTVRLPEPPKGLFQKLIERELAVRANRPKKYERPLQIAKVKAIKKWQRHVKDTGSEEVQVAILTERINLITAHLFKNHKDNSCKRSLEILVHRRRKLLNYLYRSEPLRAIQVAQDLDFRWTPPDEIDIKEVKYGTFKNTKRQFTLVGNEAEAHRIKKSQKEFKNARIESSHQRAIPLSPVKALLLEQQEKMARLQNATKPIQSTMGSFTSPLPSSSSAATSSTSTPTKSTTKQE